MTHGAWKIFGGLALVLAWNPGVFAADSDAEIVAKINQHIRQAWKENDVTPSPRAEDGEWARRVSLDVIGQIPSLNRLATFLNDESPDKRQKFVDLLLDDAEYPRNWADIWTNILVARSTRNGQESREALDKWFRSAFHKNLAYDDIVRQLVSAEGNLSENGAVGFLGNHLNENGVPATAITARVFLGLQVQCTQCHNHPFNDWKQQQFWGMNAFFRGTRRQGRVQNDFALSDGGAAEIVFFEKRSGVMEAVPRQYVDGSAPDSQLQSNPRQQLARLITNPEKPQMAKAVVNRMWGHFFGAAFTKPLDDMGPHNPPSHPQLLEELAVEFRTAGHDLKRLIRWIAASEAYNLTSSPASGNTVDEPSTGATPLFSRMYLKAFTAEQLYDSLLIATEADKTTRSTEEAGKKRAEWLRQFVQTFGTDENDESTSFNGSIPQALVMMNGPLIKAAISGDDGSFLRKVLSGEISLNRLKSGKPASAATAVVAAKPAKANGKTAPPVQATNIPAKIELLYLSALARKPTANELESLNRAFQKSGGHDPIVGLQDVFWALLNSNEFIINH